MDENVLSNLNVEDDDFLFLFHNFNNTYLQIDNYRVVCFNFGHLALTSSF